MKTIKTILMAAGFIAAMASCKKGEIEDVNLEFEDLSDAIGFIVGAPDTKGTAVTNDNITEKCSSFKCDVWMASAPQDGQPQNLVNKGTVSYVDGKWRFTDPAQQARWIDDIQTQFWAWSPMSLSPTGMAANASQITFAYTLPEPGFTNDATAQGDVLVAYSAKTFDRTDRYVTINFMHALPQINFTVVAGKIADIDITSVMLENVASTGNFTFSKESVFTCVPSGSSAYGQENPFVGAVEGTLNGATAFTTTNNFFMIPQKLNGAKITVKKSNGEILTASLSNKTTWESGKVYNYKLTFSERDLVVTLIGWEDVAGGSVDTDELSMPLWSYYAGEQL